MSSNPVINWVALTPILIVLGAAVIGVLVEAFVPERYRRNTQLVVSFLAVAGAFVAVIAQWKKVGDLGYAVVLKLNEQAAVGTLFEDRLAIVFQAIVLPCALFALLIAADRTATGEGAFAASAATQPGSSEEREANRLGAEQTEVFPLMLFSIAGMLAFTMSGDFLTMFISLEVLSLPLYVLCATARRRRALSQEAALKYFLLGAFSSAFFLMGVALLYGFSGGFNLWNRAYLEASGQELLLIAGTTLVLIGLLFKVGAVPFHSWVPDAYQGAPTPVTGFMAAGTKIAVFAAVLRLLGGADNSNTIGWSAVSLYETLKPVLWIIVIATILVGTVLGIVQRDIKRMLAYSAISHAGFLLIGVTAFFGANAAVVSATLRGQMSEVGFAANIVPIAFYLLSYGLASVGAFGVITLVRDRDEAGNILGEATAIDHWKGLGKTNPVLAVCMTVFLLSFAGIPLTSGFIGKFVVFAAGVSGGQTVLVVFAVLASAATAFFYFRVILNMFFRQPDPATSVTVASEGYAGVAIIACAALTIVLGILPGPVLGLLS
ncbi:NADH-quinone oxidoreductase subunit NuoN [Actinobaculum sp. 352]|uniref:NADH-quinone oxidoreductase subunit NuoN n=1 Tax=Actinobaculum sp. 352 TaxID=2490946 RepID=UPI000F7E3288|nr:NADH-quinone oxidoreductase subunit NuoN [Actinobaculum sp. 352]RTE48992.1 NADH-quinone oxidoreductase subunit NuoN [Actinobaculum sp. 352]